MYLSEIISAHSAARMYEEDGIAHAVNDGKHCYVTFESLEEDNRDLKCTFDE